MHTSKSKNAKTIIYDQQPLLDPSIAYMNINSDLAAEDYYKPQRFQEAIIQLITKADTASVPTTGSYHTKISSSDVHFKDNMDKTASPHANLRFMAKSDNQDNIPSPSSNPIPQVGKYVTCIEYKGYRLLKSTTNVTVDISSGEIIYHILKSNKANITQPRLVPSVYPPIPRCSSSTASSGLYMPTPQQNFILQWLVLVIIVIPLLPLF